MCAMRLTLTSQQTLEQNIKFEYSNEILILFSSPLIRKSEANLKYEPCKAVSFREEIKIIEDIHNKFILPKLQILYEVATYRNLQYIFSRGIKPLIIHFMGHGIRKDRTALVLENEDGSEGLFFIEYLDSILTKAPKPPCALAILNACHTGELAQAFEKVGVKHIVAIDSNQKILDQSACLFTKYFYPLVLSNTSVQYAYEQALQAVIIEQQKNINQTQIQSCIEGLKFQLYPLNSNIHLETLQIQKESSEIHILEYGETNISRIAILPFLGREIDMYSIILEITKSKFMPSIIGVHGIGGIGKTVLLEAIARWFLERKVYAQIWKISLDDTISITDVFEQYPSTLNTILNTSNIDLNSRKNKLNRKNSSNILVILDDIDSLIQHAHEHLNNLFEHLLTNGCTILFSSRQQLPGTVSYKDIHLSKINSTASLEIFRRYSHINKENEFENNNELMKLLDGYPFAIRIAATHLRQTRCGTKELVKRLKEKPKIVLSYKNALNIKKSSLFKTLDITLNILPTESKKIFHLAAIFPGGVNDKFIMFVYGEETIFALETLFEYSMIEIEELTIERRFYYLEPARSYAQSTLPAAFLPLLTEIKEKALQFYNEFLSDFHKYNYADLFIKNNNKNEEKNINMLLDWAFSNTEDKNHNIKKLSSKITYSMSYLRYKSKWLNSSQHHKHFENINNAILSAKQSEEWTTEFDLLFLKGLIYEDEKQYHLSLQQYESSENVAKTHKLEEKKPDATYKQGAIHEIEKDYKKAINKFNEAYNGYKKLNNQEKTIECKIKTAGIYYTIGNLKLSCKLFEEVLTTPNLKEELIKNVSEKLLDICISLVVQQKHKLGELDISILNKFISIYNDYYKYPNPNIQYLDSIDTIVKDIIGDNFAYNFFYEFISKYEKVLKEYRSRKSKKSKKL